MTPDGYMSLNEAAPLLGIRPESVAALVRQGHLDAIHVPRGTLLHRIYVCRESVAIEIERRATGMLMMGRRCLLPLGVEQCRPLWFL